MTARLSILFITLLASIALGPEVYVSAEQEGHQSRDFMSSMSGLQDDFAGPTQGAAAPNFHLKTLDGEAVQLSQLTGKRPVVLEFGSYTCPVFRMRHGSMEKMYEKFRDEADFFIVYTTEAHPRGDPSPYTGEEWVTMPNQMAGILYRQPQTEAERKEIATTARDKMEISMPVAIDDMQNSTWEQYGSAPNSAYLIGADGRVKLRQGWFEPRQFEQALVKEISRARAS